MVFQHRSMTSGGGFTLRRTFPALIVLTFGLLFFLFLSNVHYSPPSLEMTEEFYEPPFDISPPEPESDSILSPAPSSSSPVAHSASSSAVRVSPACEVWPNWRHAIPSAVPPDDDALPSLRLGSPEVLGGPAGHGCVPVADRLGPFGHSSGDQTDTQLPWSSLRWGKLQSECAAGQYSADDSNGDTSTRRLRLPPEGLDNELRDPRLDKHHTGRTAVVFRTWDAYKYYDNQMAFMRAAITELSLDTGGEYQIFILVDVKDQSVDLSSEESYAEVIERAVPKEFQDLALLFNEELLRQWYPKVDQHSAQDQMYQALQIFSYTFPEFDYIWQLEMDPRFTGNVATMLGNAAAWAEKQPRTNMWERNAQWYIEELWDGNYTAFSDHVDAQFHGGKGIWGPHPYAEFYVQPQGPSPPSRSELHWGVDEPADLINFAPLIDPIGTKWTYEHTVHGFEPPSELPRRMAIVSMTRTSRRLLRLISADQRETGSWVVSESTPETWSLLHGLKAVYAPHLVAFNIDDGDFSNAEQMDNTLNRGPPWSPAGGDLTGFLWCGNEIGLPEQRWLSASYFYWAGDAPRLWWDYTNGTCTYPLLLHPVKDD